jgi:hypothetical protein
MSTTNDRDDIETLPAPVLTPPPSKHEKWDREYAAFLEMLPDLLQTHRGKFVAVHEGRVIDSGDDKIALGLSAYERYGYIPIYVGLVTATPRIERMPSIRNVEF